MIQLYQNNTKKIFFNLLIFLFLGTLVVLENKYEELPVFFSTDISRFFLYSILLVAAFFSIHSWVLLPKYFENQSKTYKYYCIGFGTLFVLTDYYLCAEILNPLMAPKLSKIEPKYLVLLMSFVAFSTLFCIFLNFLYTSFFIKKIWFRLLEYVVNMIIFTLYMLVAFSSQQTEVILIALMSAVVFYAHTFYLFPLIFKKEKYKYLLCFLCLGVFYIAIFESFLVYYDRNKDKDIFMLGIFYLIILLLSSIYGFFRAKVINKEKLFSLKLENKDTELNLLKSQVNPHFLFNTLNTLYALALNENAPKTAETTAKLANLLRYMENDMKKEYIPITDEIKYLEDYIAIQKTRCAIEPKVRFTTKNANKTIRISPGLFIPLVENSFKHGIHLVENSALTIAISCDEKQVHFMCANTYDENSKVHQMEKGFGIGIENVQKRLELLYTHDYSFEIDKQNSTFTVNLTIPRR